MRVSSGMIEVDKGRGDEMQGDVGGQTTASRDADTKRRRSERKRSRGGLKRDLFRVETGDIVPVPRRWRGSRVDRMGS